MLDKKFKKFYALKEISKVKVIDKKSINAIKYERELLSNLNHLLIINMHYAFQDYDNLYLVLDLLTGGDLRYQISRHQRRFFSEIQTKFFVSCLIESLFYIHSKKIIHRDIKPENLIFDENGYLHITDFGIAKFYIKNNSHETSGTPGYMSPEVMQGKDHTYSVDYYAVGIIIYELMMGKRPYVGKDRKEIREQIIAKQAKITKMEIPEGWSLDAADFTNKLLIRKDINRLGYYNEAQIKEHPWLKNVDWDKISNKQLIAPFIPKKNHDNYDKNYCEELEEINVETFNRMEEYKLNKNYKELFKGFTFYNVNTRENIDAKFRQSNIVLNNKELLKKNEKNDKKIDNERNFKHNNDDNFFEEDYANNEKSKTYKNINYRYKHSSAQEQNFHLNNSLPKKITKKPKNKVTKSNNNSNNNKNHPRAPTNNNIIGNNKNNNTNKKIRKIKADDTNNNKIVKRSKSFNLNCIKCDSSTNSYLALINQLNLGMSNNNKKYFERNNNNENSKIIIDSNNNINNAMMKLSTNFYLPKKEHSLNNKITRRPKSISHLNINLIIDKSQNISNNKNNDIRNKAKIKTSLKTIKHFYKRKISLKKHISNNDFFEKKLNKNYSQGNINFNTNKKNCKNINNSNNNSLINIKSKSLNKSNNSINNNNKTLNRNSSLKRKDKNINQKQIPLPATSGKKFRRKKIGNKIDIHLNENNSSVYSLKPIASPNNTGKSLFYINKANKTLINELSLNNNESINNVNNVFVKSNYNTINIDEKINHPKESNKTINTDILFSLKKLGSFKSFKTKKNNKENNFTKLIKNKIKININGNDSKSKNKKNIEFNKTSYKFKLHKKISTGINDTDSKSQLKMSSFDMNNDLGLLNNNNYKCPSMNNKFNNYNTINNDINNNINFNKITNQKCIKENSKNKKLKTKNIIGNYSNHSIYSTASTGQNKVYNK